MLIIVVFEHRRYHIEIPPEQSHQSVATQVTFSAFKQDFFKALSTTSIMISTFLYKALPTGSMSNLSNLKSSANTEERYEDHIS